MPVCWDLSIETLLPALVGVLVVWGGAAVLYRSYLGQVLAEWLAYDRAKALRIDTLRWELRAHVEYARRDKVLDPADLNARRIEIERLRTGSRWHRVGIYLLGCPLCQHMQIALVAVLIWSSWDSLLWDAVPSVLFYAAVPTIGLKWWNRTVLDPPEVAGKTGSCGK